VLDQRMILNIVDYPSLSGTYNQVPQLSVVYTLAQNDSRRGRTVLTHVRCSPLQVQWPLAARYRAEEVPWPLLLATKTDILAFVVEPSLGNRMKGIKDESIKKPEGV
jgi:hypothetical protein